jgi:gliding motility-associated-like protein
MSKYIQKYKLVLSLLFLFVAGIARGERIIDSIVYTIAHDERFIFDCGKATPIDLFKVAKMYVSPENGYWGDRNGVPYDGNEGSFNIKERKYTTGNIFNTPTAISDTGMYKFYFYFTSSNNYCGIAQGTPFILNLYIGNVGCFITPTAGELDVAHYFCYGSSVDVNPNNTEKHTFTKPVTISDLLLTFSKDPESWRRQDRSWVNIEVYSDRERNNLIGTGDMIVDLEPKDQYDRPVSYDTMFYVTVYKDPQHVYIDSVHITVYPKSEELEIFYSPNIRDDTHKEYGMDDQITISVDTSFSYSTFFLNNKNMNKYYLGGDTTKNEIILSALAFSGVEDFVEVVVSDKYGCMERKMENVTVNVPFPTVFTPDGDGINDVFLGGDKFRNREFHLEVTNRWGSRLYFGESGWDGTYRGNKVPPGTYMYILNIKTVDGSTRTVKGTVTLIREGR